MRMSDGFQLTLTTCRRLIIRDDAQTASKYIADYIIGTAVDPLLADNLS